MSAVIPARNGAETIAACVEGILEQSVWVEEILVVDSGSTDGTLEILKDFQKVRVISIDPSDFDHGDTRNLGIRNVSTDWVVFTVQDARPADKKWLEKLFEGVLDDQVVAVCGAQIVPHTREANPAEWFRPVSQPTVTRVQFDSPNDFDRLSPAEKMRACSWDDVTALYRRDVLVRIPFRHTNFSEDAAWARDALRAGEAIVYNPVARVYHYHNETPRFTFNRTIAAIYHRYKLFGYVYAEPELFIPFARALYRVARESTLTVPEKVSWAVRNWKSRRALRAAVLAFRQAYSRGPEAIDDLYMRYCEKAPTPDTMLQSRSV